MQEGRQGGALNLDFSNLNSNGWPLIAKLYADDVYKARYNDCLLEVISDAFNTNSIQAFYDRYSTLIEPYATTELPGYSYLQSSNDFYNAVQQLNEHAESRAEAVASYLDGQ